MTGTGARLIVLWAAPNDPEAFWRHYRDVHIPLAKRMAGLRRYTLSRGLDDVRGGEPCHAIAELDVDDMPSLREALRSPEGRATAADAERMAAMASRRSMVYELEEL
jgi:uncharacterized protein (TIGR02118 family)